MAEMDFYDHIAEEYGEVTGEANRVAPAGEFLRELRRRRRFERVLDVACGTGLHAVMLAEMGAAVTGADLSAAMLARARQRADAAGASVAWVEAPMQEIARHVAGPFDLVLCLGNSLPHLLSDEDLDAALGGFARLLAPGGAVVLQLLNYTRVLVRRERIVGITRRGQVEYVRFYDFLGGRVRFNLLRIEWDGDCCTHELTETTLRAYRHEELAAALARHGLGGIEAFGGMAFGPFDEAGSDTLMVVAAAGGP